MLKKAIILCYCCFQIYQQFYIAVLLCSFSVFNDIWWFQGEIWVSHWSHYTFSSLVGCCLVFLIFLNLGFVNSCNAFRLNSRTWLLLILMIQISSMFQLITPLCFSCFKCIIKKMLYHSSKKLCFWILCFLLVVNCRVIYICVYVLVFLCY